MSSVKFERQIYFTVTQCHINLCTQFWQDCTVDHRTDAVLIKLIYLIKLFLSFCLEKLVLTEIKITSNSSF